MYIVRACTMSRNCVKVLVSRVGEGIDKMIVGEAVRWPVYGGGLDLECTCLLVIRGHHCTEMQVQSVVESAECCRECTGVQSSAECCIY